MRRNRNWSNSKNVSSLHNLAAPEAQSSTYLFFTVLITYDNTKDVRAVAMALFLAWFLLVSSNETDIVFNYDQLVCVSPMFIF